MVLINGLIRKSPSLEITPKSNLFEGNTLQFDYDDFLAGKKLEKNILIQADDIIIVH